ncbi:co-chaperone protein p23-1-like isoform X2 [Typha angustifolia]|uniref:co-chaperone protein p23-1-like isoform X2 n=1 Tax=Typha angustifolia TaxID=59011 RepID=UPI003C300D7E
MSCFSRHPTLKWAQRSDKVNLTIELPDAKDVKVTLKPEGKFNFSATKDGVPYEVDVDLFDNVNVKESKFYVGPRSIVYVVKKAEKKWWSRLLKQEGKPPAFVKVDWDKWIDEDDENETSGKNSGDKDFSKKQARKRRKSKKKKNLLQNMLSKLKLDCICKA